MANIRLTAPACRGGKVCSFVSNDGNENAQVTVTFNVGGTNYQCNVTVPPQDSKDCCVSPTETGLCNVRVSAPGATPRDAQLVLPCP